MKNFLLFLLGLLINIFTLYVILPIVIVGIAACLWVPLLFEFEGAVAVGIAISVLTLVLIGIVDHKLD